MTTQQNAVFSALLIGLACSSSSFGAYVGTKGKVTLTATATSQIGAFLIKDADLEALEAKGISFDYAENPPGYDAESEMANYYSEKVTTKQKDYGYTEEGEHFEDFHNTQVTVEAATKMFTQKFTNRDFIDGLIDQGFVPASATKHKLVVIYPADRPGHQTPPALFFIEDGASIYYVGRQYGYGDYGYDNTEDDALLLDLGTDVEAYSYKERTVYKHQKVTVEGESSWEFDDTGTTTESETYSGKVRAYVDIFPGYEDPETESYVGRGINFYFSGVMSYSGKLDTANNLYSTSSASLPASGTAGTLYEPYYNEEEDYHDYTSVGLASGGFSVSGTNVIPDIADYLDAIPPSLSELKQAIIDSYSDEGEE